MFFCATETSVWNPDCHLYNGTSRDVVLGTRTRTQVQLEYKFEVLVLVLVLIPRVLVLVLVLVVEVLVYYAISEQDTYSLPFCRWDV